MSRVKAGVKRRVYKPLRKPDHGTQTIQHSESEVEPVKTQGIKPVRSKITQVWVMKGEKYKLNQPETFVHTQVQIKVPTAVPTSLTIIVALTFILCSLAAYITKGDIYKPPPPPPGHLKHLRDLFMAFVCPLAQPIYWFLNQIW